MKRLPITPVLQESRAREISPKKTLKRKAKSFIESLARICFGFRFKSIIIRNRPRKAELAYKIRVLGNDSLETVTRFNKEIQRKAGDHYKLTFSGAFNPRTGREELFLDLILFGSTVDQFQAAKG